ncbi:hypothetical protein HELRODRAFT_178260 [Helobdella robusta]|uniref:Uncharacterized protein n=1 Tax=Helobdella robusta TaxID=6412 RepID=T1FD01_HELRO|nr:hypothetical protein HELRODRAFT_178260 [Helobdella robusta]ESN97152.1 hypothetical protein HELRODRAFT_178260 [Helobdella robusta]
MIYLSIWAQIQHINLNTEDGIGIPKKSFLFSTTTATATTTTTTAATAEKTSTTTITFTSTVATTTTACPSDATSEYSAIEAQPSAVITNGRVDRLRVWMTSCNSETTYSSFFTIKNVTAIQKLARFSVSKENVANLCFSIFVNGSRTTYEVVPRCNNQSIREDIISSGNYTFDGVGMAFNPTD